MPVHAAQNLMTTGEVARAIGVAPATVAKWSDKGLLPPAFRLPSGSSKGDRRFLVADVLAFCRERGMPFHFHGQEEPQPGGLIVVASQDQRLVRQLNEFKNCTIHEARCSSGAAFLTARLLPSILILDRAIIVHEEATETAAWFLSRMPSLRIVLVLNEDDPGEGYPPHITTIGRPFGIDQLGRVLLGVESGEGLPAS